MNNRISLADVLENFGSTFRSISVQTAAYRIGPGWYNLASVIRFSELDKKGREAGIRRDWNVLGVIKHDRLRIVSRVFSYKEGSVLFEMLNNGFVQMEDFNVRLGRSMEVLSEFGHTYWDVRFPWPYLQIQANASPWRLGQDVLQSIRSAGNNDPELQRYLSTVSYDSLNEALCFFLALTEDGLRSFESDIFVRAPIFAKINDARCTSVGRPITVTYEAHEIIANKIFVSLTASSTHNSGRNRLKMTMPVQNSDGVFEAASDPLKDVDTRIDAALIHKNIGFVYSRGWLVRDLIPRSNENPLWKLFQKFCPAEEFATLLASPGKVADAENRPQRLFETRIALFLSAFGFSAMALGPQECLRDPGTTVERGSLDVLAFHEAKRVLILGSCKINAPKESDYDNLVNVRALLLDKMENSDSFETHMVIFTGAAEARLSKELETSGSGIFPRIIHVFDTQRLKDGLASLLSEDPDWIFEQLSQRTELMSLLRS